MKKALKRFDGIEETPIAKTLAPSGGLGRYMTASGAEVMMVHYSANPKRRASSPEGREWITRELAKGYTGGMSGARWQQEMEMNPEAQESTNVWSNWEEEVKPAIVCDPFQIDERVPVWAGYDYGTTNPFAFIPVAWTAENDLYQIDEVYEEGLSVHEQFELVKTRPWFKQMIGAAGDPSIWYRNQNELRDGQAYLTSVGSIIEQNFGLTIVRGDNSMGTDVALINYLNSVLWRDLAEPKFHIFSTCKRTLSEFRRLRYKEWKHADAQNEHNRYETIVAKDNHAWDALKYLLLWRQGESPREMAPPQGTFEWYRNQLLELKRRGQMRHR